MTLCRHTPAVIVTTSDNCHVQNDMADCANQARYITLLLTHLAFHYILGIFTIAEEYVCHDENT